MAQGGLFGYGAGNFLRAYMDSKYKQQALDQESRRIDEAHREGVANRASRGMLLPEDYEYIQDHQSQIDPDMPENGSDPNQPRGLVKYSADQTSQKTPSPEPATQGAGLLSPMGQPNAGPQLPAPPSIGTLTEMGLPNAGPQLPNDQVADSDSTQQANSPEDAQAERAMPVQQPRANAAEPYWKKTGGMYVSPLARSQMQVAQSEAQSKIDATRPDSEVSVAARELLRNQVMYNRDAQNFFRQTLSSQTGQPINSSLIQNARPQDLIPDNLSLSQISQLRGAGLDPALSGGTKGVLDTLMKAKGLDIQSKKLDIMKGNQDLKRSSFEERRNQNAAQAGNAFESTPIIAQGKQTLNSLLRSNSVLNNTSKPLLNKDLNLAYQDYINAVAQGGAATEGKIHRELPETFEQEWNEMKSRLGDFDDIRKDKVGQKLVSMLQNNIATVRNDYQDAIEQQALNVADSYGSNTNPKVQATVKTKLQKYAPNAYTQRYGGGSKSQPPSGLINNRDAGMDAFLKSMRSQGAK